MRFRKGVPIHSTAVACDEIAKGRWLWWEKTYPAGRSYTVYHHAFTRNWSVATVQKMVQRGELFQAEEVGGEG